MSHHRNMFRRRDDACLSDLALDQLRLGDLQGARESQAAAHMQSCERCRERLRELDAIVAPAIDLENPDAAAARPPARRTRLWWALGLPACAAAALLLVVSLQGPGERRKGGGWQLGVIAQSPSGRVSSVSSGATLAPGDRLRFEVSAPQDAFVSVISLDGKGAVTPFVPATGEALWVRSGARRLLAGAVQLDDSLGPERLLLVACPDRTAVATVVEATRSALARARGKIEEVDRLDLACSQTSFWIRKEIRP